MSQGRNDPCSCGSGKKFKHCCQGKPGLTPARTAAPPPDEINALIGLFNSKRYAEVENNTRLLLARFPDSGAAWKILGAALQLQGKDALPALHKATELSSGNAEAHHNLAVAQKKRGMLHEAIASYRRAIQLKPDYAEAHCNLGNALREQGQLADALNSYRRAVQLQPKYADAHFNLGNTLKDLGKLDEAVSNYSRALALQPAFAAAHNNLGATLKDLNRLDEAVASYRRLLELDPNSAEAHNNLGAALKQLGQFNDAITSYQQALRLKPDYAEAHSNLGNAYGDLGNFDSALNSYRSALKLKPHLIETHSNLLFTLNYTASQSSAACLEEAKEFGRVVAAKAIAPFSTWQCAIPPERLRVGFVSGDLRNHPVGYFMESLVTQLDPRRIELFAYPTHAKEDALTARIKPRFAAWRPLSGLSDEAAARLIHADGIHVLLDVSGHTDKNRLPIFAWRPAPVQAMWLGYFATTGMAEMDFILGDRWTLPDEEQHHFVEQGWRLPGAQWCLAAPTEEIAVGPLPVLQNRTLTFGTLNNLAKMNERVVACWARILSEIPESRLYLNTGALQNPIFRQDVIARYAAHGIAEHRLILEATSGRAAALDSYNRIDIALDPFPYPGGTTSYEALWMGVPVLTLHGNSYLSHLGGSILHNAGLPDWVAADEQDYVAKAVALGSNWASLAELRARLRNQVLASPLFDAPLFARSFATAMYKMWEKNRRTKTNGHGGLHGAKYE